MSAFSRIVDDTENADRICVVPGRLHAKTTGLCFGQQSVSLECHLMEVEQLVMAAKERRAATVSASSIPGPRRCLKKLYLYIDEIKFAVYVNGLLVMCLRSVLIIRGGQGDGLDKPCFDVLVLMSLSFVLMVLFWCPVLRTLFVFKFFMFIPEQKYFTYWKLSCMWGCYDENNGVVYSLLLMLFCLKAKISIWRWLLEIFLPWSCVCKNYGVFNVHLVLILLTCRYLTCEADGVLCDSVLVEVAQTFVVVICLWTCWFSCARF